MKKKFTKTGNFEKFWKNEMNRDELKKIKGGEWVYINGEWIWIDPK
jgi:hypothetical protein